MTNSSLNMLDGPCNSNHITYSTICGHRFLRRRFSLKSLRRKYREKVSRKFSKKSRMGVFKLFFGCFLFVVVFVLYFHHFFIYLRNERLTPEEL